MGKGQVNTTFTQKKKKTVVIFISFGLVNYAGNTLMWAAMKIIHTFSTFFLFTTTDRAMRRFSISVSVSVAVSVAVSASNLHKF